MWFYVIHYVPHILYQIILFDCGTANRYICCKILNLNKRKLITSILYIKILKSLSSKLFVTAPKNVQENLVSYWFVILLVGIHSKSQQNRPELWLVLANLSGLWLCWDFICRDFVVDPLWIWKRNKKRQN